MNKHTAYEQGILLSYQAAKTIKGMNKVDFQIMSLKVAKQNFKTKKSIEDFCRGWIDTTEKKNFILL